MEFDLRPRDVIVILGAMVVIGLAFHFIVGFSLNIGEFLSQILFMVILGAVIMKTVEVVGDENEYPRMR